MSGSPLRRSDLKIESSLRSQKGVELLDTIDKLRGLGIDSDVPLPQIVVVGQQSSGKSSVLEAISGIPFPTNDGLCTRFPLEVIMRRGAKESVAVHIICQTTDFDLAEKPLIDSFNDKIKAMMPITLNDIPPIVLKASEALRVDRGQAISSHVLRIEVTGPTQDHLTLIDLPGMFYVTRDDLDFASPALVKSLADKYMRQSRTIILAVVSAKSDYATQEILETLKQTDWDGSRTVGVITGLDTVERNSARERDYLALARNEEMPLIRGWHALRNPTFEERHKPGFDRDDKEATFFAKVEPWNTLPASIRGAQALKSKLSYYLLQLIGGQMQSVVSALNAKIDECNDTIAKLGPERLNMQDKRSYLVDISTKHQHLVNAALNGPYTEAFFDEPITRLRAQIRARGDVFASEMRNRGHTCEIVDTLKYYSNIFRSTENKSYVTGAGPSTFVNDQPREILKTSYLEEVDAVLKNYRTNELDGMFDPSVVGILFRKQSSKWKYLASDFTADIGKIITVFLQTVTQYLTDSRRARLLFAHQIQPALNIRAQALELRLVELLKPYTLHHPTTHNARFSTVTAHRDAKPNGQPNDSVDSKSDEQTETTDEAALNHPAAYKLMEHMLNYYNVAIRTFVDNVVSLGVECCLLDGLDTLLSPSAITRLSDDEIEKLASDSVEDTHLRQITRLRLEKLTAGRAVCKQYEISDTCEEDAERGRVFKRSPLGRSKPSKANYSARNSRAPTPSTFTTGKDTERPTSSPPTAPLFGTSTSLSSFHLDKAVSEGFHFGKPTNPGSNAGGLFDSSTFDSFETFNTARPGSGNPPSFGPFGAPASSASRPPSFSFNSSSTTTAAANGGGVFGGKTPPRPKATPRSRTPDPSVPSSSAFGVNGGGGGSGAEGIGSGLFGNGTSPRPKTPDPSIPSPFSSSNGAKSGGGVFGSNPSPRAKKPGPSVPKVKFPSPTPDSQTSCEPDSKTSCEPDSKTSCEPPSSQPFEPFAEWEFNGMTNVFQSITMMPSYRKYSFEELRLADMEAGRGLRT